MRLRFSSFLMAAALVLAALSGVGMVSAQVTESRGSMSLVEGRRYVVAFPKVWASPTEKPMPQPMLLFISSKSKAKVRIQTPALINDAGKIDKEYTVQPNQVLKVPISIGYMPTESQTRTGYGIRVTGDKPISVCTYQAWQGNGEMARHLPVEAWGKNYFTMNFYQDKYGSDKYRPSQILIIADKDNTIVNYTPTFTLEGGRDASETAKGITQSVTLEAGETFLIQSKIDPLLTKEWTSDLSGTKIRSTKPVGVVSGHTKVAIMRYPDVLPPTGAFAAEAHFVRNNVNDAMLPTEMSGTEFVTVPVMYTGTRVTGQGGAEFGIDDDRGDVVRIVALEDNTLIETMRQNGGGLQREALISRAGESYLKTSLEVATYWKTNKKVLMGHYGKSYAKILPPAVNKEGDAPQGHPTVESGMPMLQYVPSADRWVNYGVFTAPEGMNNFMNIVFKVTDVSSIKFDGAALNSVFGGSMKLLAGTEYAYIRTPIGAGDHVLESSTPSARWAAWNYGSLDGLQQGRAYGTPIAIDLVIACDDSLAVTEQMVCGDVDAKGLIIDKDPAKCGSIFAVYAEEMENYELVIDENFNSGDKNVNFVVKVQDKRKDARAVVRVITRSGKYVEKTYIYNADKISWTPTDALNFGTVALNSPTVRTVEVKNESDHSITIKRFKVKAFPGVFQITDPVGAVTIPAQGTRTVSITGTITNTSPVVDTLIAELECFDVPMNELRIRGEEPLIVVGGQNWPDVPAASSGVRKKVTIVNPAKVNLVITGYEENKMPETDNGVAHFFTPQTTSGATLKSALPLTILPGDEYEFSVVYSPRGEAGVTHSENVVFFANATTPDNVAELVGNGVKRDLGANAPSWDVRVLDNVATTEFGVTSYPDRVTFFNVGNQPVTFTGATLRGADAGSFRLVLTDNNFGGFPYQVVGGSTSQQLYIGIEFVPTELPNRMAERNNYAAEVVFSTDAVVDGVPVEVTAPVTATAWQPQVKGADWDFGIMDLNPANPEVRTARLDILNEHFGDPQIVNPTNGTAAGTHSVRITEIAIVGNNPGQFEILNAPTVANPWVINAGAAAEQLEVRFTANIAGDFTGANGSVYRITTTGIDGKTPYTRDYKLEAFVRGGEFAVQGSEGDQYVFMSRELNVKITHQGAQSKTFAIGTPVSSVAGVFEVLPGSEYVTVPPGTDGAIARIRFTPTAVTRLQNGQVQASLSLPEAQNQGLAWRDGIFTAEIPVTDPETQQVKNAVVSGHGLFIETRAVVGSHTLKVNDRTPIMVPVKMEAVPESITAGNVKDITVRLSYDGTIFKALTTDRAVLLAGTQTEGWTIAEIIENLGSDGLASLEIKMFGPTALVSEGNKPLINVPFLGFLGRGTNSAMSCDLTLNVYPNDNDGQGDRTDHVLIHDVPGKLTLELDCANTKRLVSVSGTKFGVQPVAPNPVASAGVINYSIGLDGNTRIVLMNSNGESVLTMVNEYLTKGEYELAVDFSQLPAGTYYYRVVSGPYSSEPYPITVVR